MGIKNFKFIPGSAGLNKRNVKIAVVIVCLIMAVFGIYVLQIASIESKTGAADKKLEINDSNNSSTIQSIVNSSKTQASGPTAQIKNKTAASSAQGQTIPVVTQQDQQAANELKASMRAAISSNQLTPQTSSSSSGNTLRSQASSPVAEQDSGLPKDDQGMTSEKRNFMKSQADMGSNVLSGTVNDPVAPLVLNMGTKIPAILDQEINSDLPGQIYGHVSRDVYDSRTHSMLLIPAGSNLVGTYDSALAYGQERLLVAWKRVNLPNGQWIDIQGMGGADPVGAGFGDQVDNHYWRIFGATFLTSILAVAPQLAQPQQSNVLQAPTTGQVIGQSVGTQIAQTGTMLLQKNINIQPTIHIRAGFEFTVEVNKDIMFPAPYTGNVNKS